MSKDTSGREIGPQWHLEQQIKHYEGAAMAHRADAQRYMKLAEDEERLAEEFRDALHKVMKD